MNSASSDRGRVCLRIVQRTRASLLLILLVLGLHPSPVPGADSTSLPPDRLRSIRDAAPKSASATPARPRRVLVFNTPAHLMPSDPHKGYCIPYGAEAFRVLGEHTGAYTADISDDLARFLPDQLAAYDAVVLNNASGDWITPTESDLARAEFRRHGTGVAAVESVLRRSLLDYVNSGGGLVAIHYAIGANRSWPAFTELLGAKYAGHPWNEEVGVRVEEPGHPLLAAFPREGFRLADEIYQFGAPYDRTRVRVLLSLDTERTNMGVENIARKDSDFALAWVRSQGGGRVFYTCFGHRTEIYWHPQVLRFYLDAIQFAAGDLPAPTAPRAAVAETDRPPDDKKGFVPIFNGRDLTGWEGDTRFWSVRDGVITAETTSDQVVAENNFLIWTNAQPRDFELRFSYRIHGGNSGLYFHARKRPPGGQGEALAGPQADFSADNRWTGVLMEWTLRDILAERGQEVRIDDRGNRRVTGSLGDPADLLRAVRDQDWNDYEVLVRGPLTVLRINGTIMSRVTDHDPKRPAAGHLALQVHRGPPMKVEFKNLRINLLDPP